MDYTFWGMLLSSLVGFILGVGVGLSRSAPSETKPYDIHEEVDLFMESLEELR